MRQWKDATLYNPSEEARWRGKKETYGRSLQKPTVGRIDDLPWVVKATYRRFYLPPSEAPHTHHLAPTCSTTLLLS